MNENFDKIDDSDAYLIVGIVLCSFNHLGAGLLLVLAGCVCGLFNAFDKDAGLK